MPTKSKSTTKPKTTAKTTPKKTANHQSAGRFGAIFLIFIVIICLLAIGARIGVLIYQTSFTYVAQGQSFIFGLDANPSMGYSWTEEIDNDNIISIKTSYSSNCAAEVDGCSGTRLYTIHGSKEGVAHLALKYCKADNSDCKTADYFIKVDADKNLSELHYGTYFDGE